MSQTISAEYRIPSGPSGKWGPTLRIVRDPRKAFAAWIKTYGDPFFVHALNGPLVVTGRPDLIKQIFSEDPDTFLPFAVDTLYDMLGPGSMLLMQGDSHRRERRMAMPMFHGDRMKAYGHDMQEIADQKMRSIPVGSELELLPIATDLSLRVIVKTIFGSQKPEEIEDLTLAGRRLVKRSHPLLFFSKRMHFPFAGLSLWDRFQQCLKEINRLLDLQIDRCRRDQESAVKREDILSMMVDAVYEDGTRLETSHIRDELRTFLFAGHETSALALSWAMYHLHRHPKTLQKLREELDGLADQEPATLAQAPYLKAVVQESLRLHPIVTEVLRLLKKPLVLGDYYLPAGYAVAPAAAIAHYRQETYPDPETFRPERFLERSFSPFEFMPFGGGHRRCIGATFAQYEIAIALGTWIKRFEFSLLERREVVSARRSLVLGPSTNVRMKLIARR